MSPFISPGRMILKVAIAKLNPPEMHIVAISVVIDRPTVREFKRISLLNITEYPTVLRRDEQAWSTWLAASNTQTHSIVHSDQKRQESDHLGY